MRYLYFYYGLLSSLYYIIYIKAPQNYYLAFYSINSILQQVLYSYLGSITFQVSSYILASNIGECNSAIARYLLNSAIFCYILPTPNQLAQSQRLSGLPYIFIYISSSNPFFPFFLAQYLRNIAFYKLRFRGIYTSRNIILSSPYLIWEGLNNIPP